MPHQYPKATVILHSISALLIIFMLIIGSVVLSKMPNDDPDKIIALIGHMSLGFIILLLTLTRIFVRLNNTMPAHLSTHNALLDKLSTAAHMLLYALVLGMGISGMALALQAGLPEIYLADTIILPASFHDFLLHEAHEIIAEGLMALILLHIVGVIYHKVILKDNIMQRMSLKQPDNE